MKEFDIIKEQIKELEIALNKKDKNKIRELMIK